MDRNSISAHMSRRSSLEEVGEELEGSEEFSGLLDPSLRELILAFDTMVRYITTPSTTQVPRVSEDPVSPT